MEREPDWLAASPAYVALLLLFCLPFSLVSLSGLLACYASSACRAASFSR